MYYDSTEAKMEKLRRNLKDYVFMFGRARIGIYQLPQLSSTKEFSVFLNSLVTALKRWDFRPVYCWSHTPYGYTLILLVNGYFRPNMDEVQIIMQRIWKLHSFNTIGTLADIPVSAESFFADEDLFLRTLHDTPFFSDFQKTVDSWHQRHFACSKVL